MTSDTRSPEAIEREIERERAGLASTLETIQDKFSVETIARQLTDQFSEHGGDIGRSVTDAVKRNPIALALTGVGLAWLMMGDSSKRRNSDARDHTRSDDDSRYNRRSEGNGFQSSHPASGQNGQDAGAHRSNLTYTRGDGHSYNTPSWAKSGTEHNADVVKSARDTAAHLGSTLSGAATSAAETARDVGDTVGDKASNLTQTASDAGKAAVDGAKDLATAASERMEALQKQLAEGTEHMSAEARKRIVAARETALKARDATMATAKQGQERATDMFEEQPLVAGALAVALGAAIAAALPRSRVEDDYLGKQSDHLIEEAERIFAEEKAKLSMAAQAATTEAKKVLDEASDEIGSLAQSAMDNTKASAERIVSAAKTAGADKSGS
jgi:hypothetical protein